MVLKLDVAVQTELAECLWSSSSNSSSATSRSASMPGNFYFLIYFLYQVLTEFRKSR